MQTKIRVTTTLAACVVCVSTAQAEFSITGLTSDFGGFWQSSDSALSPVATDSMHSLTSITANGVTISTGVDDAALISNGIDFTPGEYRAFMPLPVLGDAAGQGANDDGDVSTFAGPLHPIAGNDITQYITDGINGLGLSTFANNLEATIEFYFDMIDSSHIGDGLVDFVYFNSAVGGSAEVSFTLLDASNNPMGVTVSSSENAHPSIANILNDRFDTAPPNDARSVASPQSIEGFGIELSEFGLTVQQIESARKIRVELPAASDPPFFAYNSLAMLTCATGDDDKDGICNLIEGSEDTDGDGSPDSEDTDSDDDGIPDQIEGVSDSDGDGTPDFLDTDSDDDGIGDDIEGESDTDRDGTADYLDRDSDDDGIDDSVEGTLDSDDDGIDNFRDTDSDEDGIPDSIEGDIDTDSDGTSDYIDTDSDDDSIDDALEGQTDPDEDGVPNFLDDDSDGDGVPDATEGGEDTDGDSTPNFLDTDSDNDGVSDEEEGVADSDNDGIPDFLDSEDSDGGTTGGDTGGDGDTGSDTGGDGDTGGNGTGDTGQPSDEDVTIRTGLNGIGSMETWTLLLLGIPGGLLARLRRRARDRVS